MEASHGVVGSEEGNEISNPREEVHAGDTVLLKLSQNRFCGTHESGPEAIRPAVCWGRLLVSVSGTRAAHVPGRPG
jgi:hypothetical protein